MVNKTSFTALLGGRLCQTLGIAAVVGISVGLVVLAARSASPPYIRSIAASSQQLAIAGESSTTRPSSLAIDVVGFGAVASVSAVRPHSYHSALVGSLQPSPQSPTAAQPSSGPIVDLGTIAAGGQAEARLHLVNSTGLSIEIASVETSCPCVSVELAEWRIDPGDKVEAVARIDLFDEPEFRGGLCPQVLFFDTEGQVSFDVNLKLQVSVTRAVLSTWVHEHRAVKRDWC